jgi:UDP-2-acetamido-3-amino-2,3-dideoxy-glucuronate N-acetyltransferase
MNVWLVGSGYWGSKVVATLNELNVNVKVIDIKNNQTIDMIDNKDPVILATPLWEHYKQAKQIIANGNPLYIEKPAAETASEIEELIALAGKQIVMVGHIFMHNPLFNLLKKLDLGEIKFVHSERTNLGIYQTKTSPLLSLAPHDFSIVLGLLGDVSITHVQNYNFTNNNYPDRSIVLGNNFQIDVSWLDVNRRRVVTVVGSKAQALWDEDKKTLVVKSVGIENNRLKVEDEIIHVYQGKEPLYYELEHFIECVRNNSKPITDLHQALRIAKLIDFARNNG